MIDGAWIVAKKWVKKRLIILRTSIYFYILWGYHILINYLKGEKYE